MSNSIDETLSEIYREFGFSKRERGVCTKVLVAHQATAKLYEELGMSREEALTVLTMMLCALAQTTELTVDEVIERVTRTFGILAGEPIDVLRSFYNRPKDDEHAEN